MSLKVTITIEQDNLGGAVPTALTFEHETNSLSGNPAYAADTMQTELIRATTEACQHLARMVKYRSGSGGGIASAVADLLAVVEVPHA